MPIADHPAVLVQVQVHHWAVYGRHFSHAIPDGIALAPSENG
jgi:DNA-binding ferritin-like protein